MSKTRAEIQKDINTNRMGLLNNEIILNDPEALKITGLSYLEIKNGRDKFELQLREHEQALVVAKARGEKGRPLEEIRKELSDAQMAAGKFLSMERGAQMYSQLWAESRTYGRFMQCNAKAIQQELDEAIKEEEEKAEIKKIKQNFEHEINSNPNDAEVYKRRGTLFIAKGSANGGSLTFFIQAIEDFTQAIKIDSNAKDAYLNRAEMYSQTNDFDRAIADFSKVIQLDPNNVEAYTFRGGVYSQQGKHDQAIPDFNEAIRIDPKYPNAFAFRGGSYFVKGVQDKENTDYDNAVAHVDKALADVEEALRIDPNNIMANYLKKDIMNEKPVVERMRRERQEQYDRLVREMNSASTEEKYQDLARQLREMNGFKDTAELAKKCDKRYQELKKERECNEREEAIKREDEKKRKRLIGVLATVAAVAALAAFIVIRQTGSFFKFQKNSQGTFAVTEYSGKKQVVIPATKNKISVTEIADRAFIAKKLISVTIPDGVTSIGTYAFCNNLMTSVVIPDSVTAINSYAFYNNKLTGVTLGNGVMTIGDYSFSGNVNEKGFPSYTGNRITGIVIPDSVTIIGQYAFQNNQLISVEIGNGVKTIGFCAFSDNKLTSITIPDSVTLIDNGAFTGNKLTSIVIPDGVTSIGADAFRENQLTSLVIGNKVVSIGDRAFGGNSLASIIIPNSVTSVEADAFAGNPITSVRIGANVKLGTTASGGILGANNGFNSAYTNNGRRAGTYTRPDTNSTRWTRR